MPRLTDLTEKQWAKIKTRMMANEPVRALAREFGISEGAIRKRFGARAKKIKTLANQLVTAEKEIEKEDVGTQAEVRSYADRLRRIMDNMSDGAEHGAATYAKAARMAKAALDRVDEDNPMDYVEHIQAASALTRVANDAATVPLVVIKHHESKPLPEISTPSIDVSKVSTAALAEIMAAQDAAKSS